ncbi:MAG: hypothetical protein HGB06_01930 [Chlorobaculum sp.]|nr:hypothetical protein [Chlorobaculum sp.]
MPKKFIVTISAICLLAATPSVASESGASFEETVRVQREQISAAIADPVNGCGQFQWRYAERGADLVYEPVSGYVWATFPDLAIQFTHDEAQKYLDSLTLAGQKGWRLLTEEALFPSSLGVLYNIDLRVSNADILRFRVPSIAEYSKSSTLLSGISHSGGYSHYFIRNGLFNDSRDTAQAYLLAVRPFNELDRLVADNRQRTDSELLRMVAGYLLKGQTTLIFEPPQTPVLPPYPPAPEIVKGEFETTPQYTARRDAALKGWEERKAAIDEAYLRSEESYRQAVAASESKYLGDLVRMHEQIGYQRQVAIESAWQLLFGDPVFDAVSYDADAQSFRIKLRSARRAFMQEISVPVPIAEAPAYKARLLDKSLVPAVRLDIDNAGVVSFAGMDVKTNDIRINDEYQQTLKLNNIAAYRSFIAKNPSAPQIADARVRMAGLEKAVADRAASVEAMVAAERAKRAEEQRAELVKYNQKKSVGDKICLNMRFLLFFHTKVTGYVEGVSGNRIHVRIADTEHQSVRYHGVDLEPGLLIWDYFNNWKAFE